MAISVEQIDIWRGVQTETQILEFKEAKNTLNSTTLFEYCIAISNEGGGHLILGVKNSPPREVVGTKAVNNPVGMANEIYQKVGFRVDIEEVAHPQGRVLVFKIPSRPKGHPYHLEGKYLMRSGASLTAMSPERLREIFAEGKPDWLDESSEIGEVSPETVIGLLDTQAYFERLNMPYPNDRTGVLNRLIQERLVDEPVSGRFAIKRLAAILLARRLNEFPEVSRKAPRLIVYSGKDKFSVKLDQPGNRGYAAGYKGLVNYIMALLPQNEIVENALRKEVKMVPEIVIRELVANALIHQDFNLSGMSVTVEVYSDRIDISNPGLPVVELERFIDGYRSRNERLADFMRRMKACEERGLGVDRVIQAAELWQLPAPQFRADNTRTVVTIFGPKPFSSMTREDRIRACYQHCVLKYVGNDRMTNETLRQRFKLPETKMTTTSQIIADTIKAALVKSDPSVGGSRKYARYVPFWA